MKIFNFFDSIFEKKHSLRPPEPQKSYVLPNHKKPILQYDVENKKKSEIAG